MPMASSYALPPPPPQGSDFHYHAGHAHSHSYSGPSSHLSPNPNTFLTTNGGSSIKKAKSNASLYTHKESSREASPLPSPYHEHANPLAYHQNASAHQANGQLNGHPHSHADHHTPSFSTMKSRPRGQSDLGRPSSGYAPMASTSWFSLPEALTSLLIPLPYILASAAYSTGSGFQDDGLPPLSAYARLQKSLIEEESPTYHVYEKTGSGFVEACTLTSGTLLLVGMLAKIRSSERRLDRRKDKLESPPAVSDMLTPSAAYKMGVRALSVGLPFYASTQIGGMRTGLLLLVSAASGTVTADTVLRPVLTDWRHILKLRIGSIGVVMLALLLDFAGITFAASSVDLMLGYLALACSVLFVPLPLPALATKQPAVSSDSTWTHPAASPLLSSVGDVNLTLASGVVMSLLTIVVSFILSVSPPITLGAIFCSSLALACSASTLVFAQPSLLRSRYKAGLGLGCSVIATCAFLFSPSLWPGTILNGGLSGLSYLGVLYDTTTTTAHTHHEDHVDEHLHPPHMHHHPSGRHSWFTKMLLESCEPGSLAHGILSEKDSRRIAYFTCLNFAFMIVQGIYGYLSGSLGLLSDTVHMFFDCLGLVVGLGAAVASKWPTSPERPYGWGKLNTLAGFGNGIFLMLVSVEFVWEAMEGIVEGKELRHVQELLVVSTLGFLVNMTGLFAFGHAHAGHDHGHSHSHHPHSHTHSPAPSLSHDHLQSRRGSEDSVLSHISHHSHVHSLANGNAHHLEHAHEHKTDSHGHDHHNDNMHGIFLHVAADAGGSLAVILSTALTLWKPWYLWDPLATILIAILIFAAAVPLVTSSGQRLLLVIPDELEYNIKQTLQELGELRGVVGYAVPRFWLDDKDKSREDHHGHAHGHDHGSHGREEVLGVIHVIANPAADLEDVRARVEQFVADKGMDLVIHVEREGEGQCWCGGAAVTPRPQ